uniref:EGF-like domain-containing protein n=1 Tax=Arion vulgaris TaxID=1028688 RepID=A0A0B7BBJ4_9EUPU
MLICVCRCGSIIDSDVPISCKCITQNVHSATMGKQSPAAANNNIDRMTLVYFLLLVYSLKGCLGVSHTSTVISKPLHTFDHLKGFSHFSNDERISHRIQPGSFGVYRRMQMGIINKFLNTKNNSKDNNNLSRETILKVLLHNIGQLKEPGMKDSAHRITETGENGNARERHFVEKSRKDQRITQTQYISLPEFFLGSSRYVGSTTPPLLLSFTKAKNSVTKQEDRILDIPRVNKLKSRANRNEHIENVMNSALASRQQHDTVNFLPASTSHSSDSNNIEKTNFNENTFQQGDIKHINNELNNNENQLHEKSDIVTKTRKENVVEVKDTDSISKLIHETVKKMENIMMNRVYETSNLFTSVDRLTESMPLKFSPGTSNHSISKPNEAYSSVFNDSRAVENNEKKENNVESVHTQVQSADGVANLTADVIKAVTSRKIPKEAQFWRKVSAYLDSDDYLSRTRRNAASKKKHKGRRVMHVSITYGHVMPCEHKDRFYCMNGGTCVYVGALDIRTCRCPIGYTGVRCELIDQEYILSLLTDTLMFS